jgi:integrase
VPVECGRGKAPEAVLEVVRHSIPGIGAPERRWQHTLVRMVREVRTAHQLLDNLALFNLAIDSKLRCCDVVALKVEDVAPNGYSIDRATVRQKKTGRPVRFELTEQTRQAVDGYIRAADKKPGEFLFTASRGLGQCMTTRQYARLLSEWIASIGLDPHLFGTHSLRRTKARR